MHAPWREFYAKPRGYDNAPCPPDVCDLPAPNSLSVTKAVPHLRTPSGLKPTEKDRMIGPRPSVYRRFVVEKERPARVATSVAVAWELLNASGLLFQSREPRSILRPR
jgi:hypothetical protein